MLSDEHRARTNRRHTCVPIKPLPGSTASALLLIYVASVEVETCLLQAIRSALLLIYVASVEVETCLLCCRRYDIAIPLSDLKC